MAKFYYKARDPKGTLIDGTINAATPWLARKALNKQNLIVLDLNRFHLKMMFQALNSEVERLSQKISPEEQMVLMNQIETGISVGIPIVKMLDLLQKDQENKFLRAVINEIIADVVEGTSLHEAFGKHKTIFEPSVIGLIKTGELTGKLEETMGRVTQMIEQQSENRAKIKAATFYPKIVLFVMMVVLVIAVYFIIPKMKTFVATLGGELPWVTSFVITVSDLFTHYWYLILAAVLGVRYSYQKFASKPEGKVAIDRFKLKIPIFGKTFLFLELNNICVVLELLISSGVPLIEALETLKDSQKNEIFKQETTFRHGRRSR